tara:strand:+ start:68 stop:511 length:444 start_codon:yes stop_codon:yes gene_type:complete
MTNQKVILLAIGIIVFNLILAFFNGFIGMLTSPIAITAITALIGFKLVKTNPIIKTFILLCIIITNDIGIRLYSSGNYDQVGQALIQISFAITMVPTLGILLTAIFSVKNQIIRDKILATFFFIGLIGIYVFLFNNLGPGWRFYEWN